MKATNGKCGVFVALAAVLLVTAALLISCPDPVGYQPPAGMGYITVSISEFSGERTVLPAAGTWTSYNLSIQKYTTLGGTDAEGSPITRNGITDLTAHINLAPGNYELTVTANLTAGAAAVGTSAPFTISVGTGTSVSVVLKPLPYTLFTGNGTFAYTINLNSLPATLAMTITPLAAGASHLGGASFSVSDGGPTSITLTPGAYSVFLEATVGVGIARITEVVNVHQNLTSSVTFEYNGSYFVAYIDGITVSYATDDTKPVLTKSSAPNAVAEGATISVVAGTPETITITNSGSFDSIRWYCGGSDTLVVDGGGTTFAIIAGTAPFTDEITYPVTVVGITANGAYSTNFKVTITPP